MIYFTVESEHCAHSQTPNLPTPSSVFVLLYISIYLSIYKYIYIYDAFTLFPCVSLLAGALFRVSFVCLLETSGTPEKLMRQQGRKTKPTPRSTITSCGSENILRIMYVCNSRINCLHAWCVSTNTNAIPTPCQNYTQTIPKPYQNNANTILKPYQNQTKTNTKLYKQHTKTMPKLYPNHTNTIPKQT